MTIRTPAGNWTRRFRVISNRGTGDWGHGNCIDWRWEGFAWRYAHWRALLAPMTARFYTKAMHDNTLVSCGAKYTQRAGGGVASDCAWTLRRLARESRTRGRASKGVFFPALTGRANFCRLSGAKVSLLSERGMAVSNLNPQTAKSGAPGIDVHRLRQ